MDIYFQKQGMKSFHLLGSVSASPRTPQFIRLTVYEYKAKENKRQKQ